MSSEELGFFTLLGIQVFSGILPLAFIGLLMFIFRRAAPARSEDLPDSISLVLIKKFRRLQQQYILMLLGFTVPAAIVVLLVLAFMGHLATLALPNAVYTVVPNLIIWCLPAMFTGLLISSLFSDRVLRHRVGEDRLEFEAWLSVTQGFDDRKLALPLAALFGVAISTFVFLSLDSYILVQEDRIVASHFLSVGEEDYAYDQITRIRLSYKNKSAGGGIVQRPEGVYVVDFTDGRSIGSNDFLGEPQQGDRHELFQYIATQSGHEIVTVDLFEFAEL